MAQRKKDGKLEAIPPTESMWYLLYVSCPFLNDPGFLKKFRRRFRIPYDSYIAFVEEARAKEWFPRWSRPDAMGKACSPLELLILGAFRYLGRGFTFNDLEEATAISEEVHRCFFHKFIEVGSTILYDRYVNTPVNIEMVKEHMVEFELAGMPGAFGSTDATHIVHKRCSWRIRRAHLGHKTKYTTRTYNLTVNHRRRILGSTCGHPGSWNDKTLVLFDNFIRDIKRGDLLNDYTFELFERREDGEVVPITYKGVWFLVDNGYHNWSTTVPPFTNTILRKEVRWSEWLESMRKDVKCTFGILKGRWRILKTGVMLHSSKNVDQIWLTCCALHNMLLDVDGLDEPWDGVRIPTSIWVNGEFSCIEDEECPMVIRRIMSPAEIRNFDTTATGLGGPPPTAEEDAEDDLNNNVVIPNGTIRNVRDLTLQYFRSKLVEHFDIQFTKNAIVWPKRRNNKPEVEH